MKELERYGDLKNRPMIVEANKIDLPGSEENLARLREKLAGTGIQIFPVSAAEGKGFTELMRAAAAMLRTLPPIEPFFEETPFEDMAEEQIKVSVEDGVYVLSGPSMQHLVDSVNFADEDSLNWFHRTLRRWGVIDMLREAGAGEGDTVRLGDMEFDFVE